MSKRNPEARRLRQSRFRPRKISPKKGKASYNRRPKHAHMRDGGSVSGIASRGACASRSPRISRISLRSIA